MTMEINPKVWYNVASLDVIRVCHTIVRENRLRDEQERFGNIGCSCFMLAISLLLSILFIKKVLVLITLAREGNKCVILSFLML